MRTFALVMACLAFAGQARRAQRQQTSEKVDSAPVQSLANFLLASNPAAGFQVTGAQYGHRISGRGTRTGKPTVSPFIAKHAAATIHHGTSGKSRIATVPEMKIDFTDPETWITIGFGFGGIALGWYTGVFLKWTSWDQKQTKMNMQPCVDCYGRKVLDCSFCKGTGKAYEADDVSQRQKRRLEALQKAALENSDLRDTVIVEDWEEGLKEVSVTEGTALESYEKKFKDISACTWCYGRGVVLCSNCDGEGIQPQFYDRYTPDDFMD